MITFRPAFAARRVTPIARTAWAVLFLIPCIVLHAGNSNAHAREAAPPRIVVIYGPSSLEVGELANFRVRLADGATQPVIYRWRMGDGTRAEGNGVTHRFLRPGRYRIVATTRNEDGSDSDTLLVTVRKRADARPADTFRQIDDGRRSTVNQDSTSGNTRPAAGAPRAAPERNTSLRGSKPIVWSYGGYTLLVASVPDRLDAEAAARDLGRRGYRAGLYLDESGRGSPIYRVVAGQFATENEAVRARHRLLAEGHEGAFLVQRVPVPARDRP